MFTSKTLLLSVTMLAAVVQMTVASEATQRKTACNVFIGVDESFWVREEGNMTRIREMAVDVIRGLNGIFSESVFGGHPKFHGFHFKLSTVEPVQGVCDSCNATALDFSRQLLEAFAKTDYSKYCLAYLFTNQNLHTTVSLANHDVVCASYRPTCPSGQRTCRITGNAGTWPHWRSPNVGVVSFDKVGLHMDDDFVLVSVAHAFGYSFGALSDDGVAENAKCAGQGYLMGSHPRQLRYSSCSFRAMISSLNELVSGDSSGRVNTVAGKRKNCFVPANDELEPAFCGNGAVEAGEECDCGLKREDCKDPCCYPAIIENAVKLANSDATPCHWRSLPECADRRNRTAERAAADGSDVASDDLRSSLPLEAALTDVSDLVARVERLEQEHTTFRDNFIDIYNLLRGKQDKPPRA